MKVLITGGSGGIGNAIANRFKENGYIVITPSRSNLRQTNPYPICLV